METRFFIGMVTFATWAGSKLWNVGVNVEYRVYNVEAGFLKSIFCICFFVDK